MGLKDKASKIDFASLMTQHAPVPEAKQPKTAPGAMMAYANDARSELVRENEKLREQADRALALEVQRDEAVNDLRAWDGAKPTRLLDASQIKRSRYANRHESSFTGVDFERLKRDVLEAGGNVQPIKVRSVGKVKEGARYEVVYGHRRLEACRQLGLPVLSVVDNLDDRTLFIEMERENRERADLSPWEQGVMYAQALEHGLFASNRQLAAALGIDHSNLGKSLALARLPVEVTSAFASPLDLQLRWAPVLNKALEEDPEGVKLRAAALAQSRGVLSPREILTRLLAPGDRLGGDESMQAHIFAVRGKNVATLAFERSGRATLRVSAQLSAEQQRALATVIEGFIATL